MTEDNQWCAALRRDGERCRGRPLPGEALCFAHSPTTAARREAARRAGGQGRSLSARAIKRMPPSLLPMLDQLHIAMAEVHAGAITPAQGGAIASLAGAVLRTWEVAVAESKINQLLYARVLDLHAITPDNTRDREEIKGDDGDDEEG